MIAPFQVLLPGRILFGRGEAAKTATLAAGFGRRVLLVHGRDAARAAWLLADLGRERCEVHSLTCATEPDLPMLDAALATGRAFGPDLVIGLGGGAALDLAKALAALIPATGPVLTHLESAGPGLPLIQGPLPFIAVPTTSGTGAEATKNAVIGVPAQRRKVSLRDDRMMARLAIVDPALTDGCPRSVTLASGLDALTQVIEPYLCNRTNPATDALARAAIPLALAALPALMKGEDAAARDAMAWVQPVGGDCAGQRGSGRGAWAGRGDRRHDRGRAWRDLRHAAALRDRGEPCRRAPRTDCRSSGRSGRIAVGGLRRRAGGRGAAPLVAPQRPARPVIPWSGRQGS